MATEHSALCSVVPPGMLCFVRALILAFALVAVAPVDAVAASWLDQDPLANWNKMRAPVPEAPPPQGDPAILRGARSRSGYRAAPRIARWSRVADASGPGHDQWRHHHRPRRHLGGR